VVLDRASFEPIQEIGFRFLLLGNRWLRSLTNTAGTLNLEWFLNNLAAEERIEAKKRGVSVYQILEEEAASVPIGSGGIIYHPYINTTGVGAPFMNAAARAQFFGIEVDHDRRHLLRAVYEGSCACQSELYNLIPSRYPKYLSLAVELVRLSGARCLLIVPDLRMLVPKGASSVPKAMHFGRHWRR
jgi:xylulokinase/L-xylulokinase